MSKKKSDVFFNDIKDRKIMYREYESNRKKHLTKNKTKSNANKLQTVNSNNLTKQVKILKPVAYF